jgi:hypothetical protein
VEAEGGPKDSYCLFERRKFGRMKEAVRNYRQLRRQLKEMEKLSRQIIFQMAPHTSRRKRLSQKVLGTN